MPPTTRLSATLSGVAGEYFVAAELSRRGHIASLTQRTTRGIDLLATNEPGTKSFTVQVKTAQDGGKAWLLDQSAETNTAPNFFYIFVNLKSVDGAPEYHIVPSTTSRPLAPKTTKTGSPAPAATANPARTRACASSATPAAPISIAGTSSA